MLFSKIVSDVRAALPQYKVVRRHGEERWNFLFGHAAANSVQFITC